MNFIVVVSFLFLAAANCLPTPNATECTKEQLNEKNQCKNIVEASAEYLLIKAQLQNIIPQCIPNYQNACTRRNDLVDNCLEQFEFNAVQNQSLSYDEKRKILQSINCLPSFTNNFWNIMEQKLGRRAVNGQQQSASNGQQQRGFNGQQRDVPNGQQQAAINNQQQAQNFFTTPTPSSTPAESIWTPASTPQGNNGQIINNGNEQCIPTNQQFSCLIDSLIQTNQMAEMAQRLLQQLNQCKTTSANCQFDADYNRGDCSNDDVNQLNIQLQQCVANQG